MRRIRLFILILVMALVGGCQPAPDLNRPWNTATPQAGPSNGPAAATPAPTQAPATVSTPTAAPGQAGSSTTLQVIGAEDNPPFMYADANGSPAGLYPILVGAVFKRMGIDIAIKTYPWNRAVAMAQNGDGPLPGIYKNEERLKVFDYSDAIYPNKILLYVLKGKTFKFEKPGDLAGKNIGIMSGWTYGDVFDQEKAKGTFTTEEVASDKDNFQKLVLGRLDAILAESTIAEQIIQEQQYTGKVEALPTPMIVFDAYMVFAKSVNQGAVLKTFNTTLAAMKQDGSYDKLIADWSGKK